MNMTDSFHHSAVSTTNYKEEKLITNIIEHLVPFSKKEPPENKDLFVYEETDAGRKYGILRFFKKGSMMPNYDGKDGKTPEERLLEEIFHGSLEDMYAPATCFYRYVKNKRSTGGTWVQSSINPLDASYAIINPEHMR